MSGETGTNSPDGPAPTANVRQLQRRLWVAAKRSPERRFHALMDRVWRADLLWEAWRRVKRNRGGAGVDGETLTAVGRELLGFIWASGVTIEAAEGQASPVAT